MRTGLHSDLEKEGNRRKNAAENALAEHNTLTFTERSEGCSRLWYLVQKGEQQVPLSTKLLWLPSEAQQPDKTSPEDVRLA